MRQVVQHILHADPKWWHGWAPLFLCPGLVPVLAPHDWPRWAVMWLLAFEIFCGCKWLTWRRTAVRGAPLLWQVDYTGVGRTRALQPTCHAIGASQG